MRVTLILILSITISACSRDTTEEDLWAGIDYYTELIGESISDVQGIDQYEYYKYFNLNTYTKKFESGIYGEIGIGELNGKIQLVQLSNYEPILSADQVEGIIKESINRHGKLSAYTYDKAWRVLSIEHKVNDLNISKDFGESTQHKGMFYFRLDYRTDDVVKEMEDKFEVIVY